MIEEAVAKTWLREDLPRITYFLEIERPVNVILKPHWAKSHYSFITGNIRLGLRDVRDRDTFRKRLTHEVLHAKGLRHTPKTRELGYYSTWTKDTLSDKVRDWIFYGKPKPYELDILLRGV